MTNLPPLDVQQRYTIEEAAAYLRQSRAKTYSDIREGRLTIIKDGSRTYVPGSEIAARSGSSEPKTETGRDRAGV